MAARFGTSGLRGLVTELTEDVIYRHVSSFIIHIRSQSLGRPITKACVGWDFRESSPTIVNHVKAALLSNGVEPLLAGLLPTQAVALWAMGQSMPTIMVTGSHIPEDRNGLKFYSPLGEISKEDEAAIAQLANSMDVSVASSFETQSFADVRSDIALHFIQRYVLAFGTGALRGMKVGVFQHSSVARDLICDILIGLGAEVVALGREAGFVALDTEALSATTVAQLRAWAKETPLDAIVSADGDGDRPLLTDETGRCLRGDEIGVIASRFLNADIVVTPVTSNSGLETQLAAQIVRTAVGSPHVIAAMQMARQSGSQRVVGFEANGGFLVGAEFALPAGPLARLLTRDSILPLVAVLCSCAQDGQSVSGVKAQLKLPCAISELLEDMDASFSLPFIAELLASKEELAGFFEPFGTVMSVDETDGLRVTLTASRVVHFRPSGNSPGLRIYVEDATADKANKLLAGVKQSISNAHAAFLDARVFDSADLYQS